MTIMNTVKYDLTRKEKTLKKKKMRANMPRMKKNKNKREHFKIFFIR